MMGGIREHMPEELGQGVFDLLVIGGGIVGSRVAFDAARLGLRAALVDAGFRVAVGCRLNRARDRHGS